MMGQACIYSNLQCIVIFSPSIALVASGRYAKIFHVFEDQLSAAD